MTQLTVHSPIELFFVSCRQASKEFCRRVLEGLGSIPPFVLVARNILQASIPSPYEIPSDFEVSVSGTKISVHKIVLVHYGGDLYIVKIESGPTHAQAVTELMGQIHPYKSARRDIFDFASNGIYEMPGTGGQQATFGGNRKNVSYAPDCGILSTYPFQQGTALLRGVFIAEVEVFNRDGAAALVSRMSEYAKIPQNKYLLAMKIYKDRGKHVHHSAIAVLWKRNGNAAAYNVQEIMNFGLNPAKPEEIDKWIEIETGTLKKLPPRQVSRRHQSRWQHAPGVTHTVGAVKSQSNGNVTLQILDQDLVDGVVDAENNSVVVDNTHHIDIDFGNILNACDGFEG